MISKWNHPVFPTIFLLIFLLFFFIESLNPKSTNFFYFFWQSQNKSLNSILIWIVLEKKYQKTFIYFDLEQNSCSFIGEIHQYLNLIGFFKLPHEFICQLIDINPANHKAFRTTLLSVIFLFRNYFNWCFWP